MYQYWGEWMDEFPCLGWSAKVSINWSCISKIQSLYFALSILMLTFILVLLNTYFLSDLNNKSKELEKTNYYKHWTREQLDDVVNWRKV